MRDLATESLRRACAMRLLFAAEALDDPDPARRAKSANLLLEWRDVERLPALLRRPIESLLPTVRAARDGHGVPEEEKHRFRTTVDELLEVLP